MLLIKYKISFDTLDLDRVRVGLSFVACDEMDKQCCDGTKLVLLIFVLQNLASLYQCLYRSKGTPS